MASSSQPQIDDELSPDVEVSNPLITWKNKLHDKIVGITLSKLQSEINLSNDEDRIKLILQELVSTGKKESFIIVTPNITTKDTKSSIVHQALGKLHYNSNHIDESWQEYTKSIAYAPPGTHELTLAYANRSAILFKSNMFADSLADLNRIPEESYPDDIKGHLHLRKAQCHYHLSVADLNESPGWLEFIKSDKRESCELELKKQKKTLETIKKKNNIEDLKCYKFDFEDVPPFLHHENSIVPGLSDAVKLNYSPEFGRYISAARNIKPGEVLGVQEAYADVVNQDLKYTLCGFCRKQTWSSIPCNNCSHVMYCSEDCLYTALRYHHDIECTVIPQLFEFGVHDKFFVALRLTIMAIKETGCSLEVLKKQCRDIDASKDNIKKGFIKGILQPKTFSSIRGLSSSYSPHLVYHECASLANSIITAYFLGKKIGLFSQDNLDVLKDNDNFIFLVGIIDKNARVAIYNGYDIFMPYLEGDSLFTGTAVIPAFSFFNHSCQQMVIHSRHGNKFVIRAVCPIKKDEQIFTNYGAGWFLQSKEERRKYLRFYNFLCNCKACCDDWSLKKKITEAEGVAHGFNEGDIARIDQVFSRQSKHIVQWRDNACEHFRENNKLIVSSNSLVQVINAVDICHEHFEPNSAEILEATLSFANAVKFAQVPFILLD